MIVLRMSLHALSWPAVACAVPIQTLWLLLLQQSPAAWGNCSACACTQLHGGWALAPGKAHAAAGKQAVQAAAPVARLL